MLCSISSYKGWYPFEYIFLRGSGYVIDWIKTRKQIETGYVPSKISHVYWEATAVTLKSSVILVTCS